MTSQMEFRNYRSSAQLVHCNIHQKRYSDVPYKTGCTIDAILVSHRTPERALAPILESFSRVWEDKLGKGLSKIVGACCLAFGV